VKKKSLTVGLAVLIVLVSWPLLDIACPIGQATEEQIEQSILDGLLWLVGQQDTLNGSWGTSYRVALTAFAVLKLETYAIETGQLNEEGKIDQVIIEGTDYYSNLVAGLNYMMSNAHSLVLLEPDGNEDDKAVYFVYQNNYYTSIAMMAIAASTHPEWTATVDGVEMSYEDILQDSVDYFVWGQNDGAAAGDMRGGWGYGPNDSYVSDQSNSGYVVLGLAYAQAPHPYGFELDIPQSTKDELSIWIDRVQCDDGGSLYWPGYSGCYWENMLKTGNLLFEMALVGDTKGTPRVQNALSYIATHWYDQDMIIGWSGDVCVDDDGDGLFDEDPYNYVDDDMDGLVDEDRGDTHFQAAYCLMKGLEAMNIGIDEIPGVSDWYQDLADVIVYQQNVDGSWNSSPNYVWPEGNYGPMSGPILATEWALLTLEKAAPPVGEIPVYVDIKPGSCPNPLNLKSKGVLPVAVLGTADFDVTAIDPATVRLALTAGDEEPSVFPLRWSIEDVATPFNGVECDCHELNGDGYLDLTLKFDTQELVDVLGLDAYAGNTIPLILTGNLMGENGEGMPIRGSDCIRILQTGKK
jgi:hypothetical protein